jgi:hypothetical protein
MVALDAVVDGTNCVASSLMLMHARQGGGVAVGDWHNVL